MAWSALVTAGIIWVHLTGARDGAPPEINAFGWMLIVCGGLQIANLILEQAEVLEDFVAWRKAQWEDEPKQPEPQ